MGKDAADKAFFSKTDVFAELMNYDLYKGERVITSVESMDPGELVTEEKEGDIAQFLRIRDVLKKASIKKDDNAIYMLLGIESQTIVDYSMPIRCMLYDAMLHERQWKDSTRRKGAKLLPVYTLVVYTGPGEWRGPTSLQAMLTLDERVIDKIADYKLNVLNINTLPREDIEAFNSELFQVLNFLWHRNDEAALERLSKNERYRNVSVEAVEFINQHTKHKFEIPEGAEVIDMCKGLDQLCERKRAEGHTEGRIDAEIANINRTLEALKNGDVTEKGFFTITGKTIQEATQWLDTYNSSRLTHN